jgi:hypothetical protein
MPTDDELRAQATRSIKRKRDFKVHLAVYVVVNIILLVV